MIDKVIRDGNELIADFLGWELSMIDEITKCAIYEIPNNFYEDTGTTEWYLDSFLFNDDWNWIHFLWEELHRKVCIPMVRDNQHLKFIRPLIQETKKAIVWGHKETVYKNMVELIKLYNLQFNQ